jgi:hypothetical protein
MTSSKAPNKWCHNRVLLCAKCMINVKEKYFKTKYRPVGILIECLRYDVLN